MYKMWEMGSYFALHICQYFTVMFDQQNNAIVCIGSPSIFRTVNPFYVAKKREEKKQRFYVNVCGAGKALCCERLAQWLRFSSLPPSPSPSHSLYQLILKLMASKSRRAHCFCFIVGIFTLLSLEKRGDLFSCFFTYAHFYGQLSIKTFE